MKLMYNTILRFIPLLVFIISIDVQAQEIYPEKTWDKYKTPEEINYSSSKLEDARDYSKQIKSSAVVIVVGGKILYEWGKVEEKYKTHSLRKSFLSAMYGNYVRNGIIDLDKTMEELDIDDEPPLTEAERKATVRDCIKARSGIYHPALYESSGMKALKPPRNSEKPGIHWYYNNWDFNAAGTIFTQLTGKDIFEALKEEIADPIQMEHFEVEDGNYVMGEESIHPAYPFIITAHDCARFGLLMMRNGKWKDKQVVPADWVEEITSYHSDATLYSSSGYGYMWWVAKNNNKFPHLPGVDLPESSYSARGAGGHYILVLPAYDMVIVHRVNTNVPGKRVVKEEMGKLVQMILDSKL